MRRPWATVIIPTVGRPGLARALAAVRAEVAAAGVEVLVVADSHGQDFAAALVPAPALCQAYQARYVEHDGGAHMVGHAQRNHGMAQAQGAWLLFGQDDNVWLPGVGPRLWEIAGHGPRVPHVWQVQLRAGDIVPRERRLAYGQCDADGFMVPNDPARLGVWDASVYHGDWHFIHATVGLYGGAWEYVPHVLARGQAHA